MDIEATIRLISIAAIPILFAITLHEAAHAYTAKHFGDMTAYQLGRTSLNPLHHIDPVGTVMLPLLTLIFGGVLFGWAKPVPVDLRGVRNPKKAMLWVALAGPASNLVMALGWAMLYKLALINPDNYFANPLQQMAGMGIKINAVLLVLNLLPLPPLDGGRVLVSLLPYRQAVLVSKVEPYGMFILLFLAVTPVLGAILQPLLRGVFSIISSLFGI